MTVMMMSWRATPLGWGGEALNPCSHRFTYTQPASVEDLLCVDLVIYIRQKLHWICFIGPIKEFVDPKSSAQTTPQYSRHDIVSPKSRLDNNSRDVLYVLIDILSLTPTPFCLPTRFP